MTLTEMQKGALLSGRLPKGCELCAQGSKLVLLVTGLCTAACYYCPLSEAKRGRDVVYANELRVRRWADVRAEAEKIGAEGAGITGGDPLAVMRRTCAYVRMLKHTFGSDFHIHLYTATADPARVRALARAGVDEVRFHPPLEIWARLSESRFPEAISMGYREGMSVGVEIPSIPGLEKETRALLRSLADTEVEFVNLNELEFSYTNWRALRDLGHEPRDDVSSGVRWSEQLARRLVKGWKGDFALHYCSASFKDAVQLRNRLLRRAQRVALPSDIISKDGTLIKGIIETSEPARLRRLLIQRYSIPPELIRTDRAKRRLEIAPWILEELATHIGYRSFIIEEYPTADRLEVERSPLGANKD
ncbi:MAG: radical SAM protein [Candidatus Thermoplasmatota archaeon]